MQADSNILLTTVSVKNAPEFKLKKPFIREVYTMGWFLFIGVIVVAAFVFLCNSSEGGNSSLVSSSNNQSAISRDFVEHSVKFFDGFLSLCDKHRVLGGATLLQQGTATHEIKAQLRCKLYTIDDEHAEWFFLSQKLDGKMQKTKWMTQ